MSAFTTPQIPPDADLKSLLNILAVVLKELDWIINGNLDAKNIKAQSITAEEIKALTITATQIAANAINADKISAGAVTTDKLDAGAVTADKITVSQLSAIAANLGTITAGIIYGAFIATANGTYPRIEFSSVGNLLAAYYDADTYVSIVPGDGSTTDPNVQFWHPDIHSAIGHSHSTGDQFVILSSKQIFIDTLTSIGLKSSAGTISDLVSTLLGFTSSISTLASSLAGKANTGGSTSSVSISDSHNHGIASTDYIQLYDAAGNPTTLTQWVPWAGSSAHSHTI